MEYRTTKQGSTEVEADLLVVPVSREALHARRNEVMRIVSEKSRLDVFRACEREQFRARPGQTIVFRELSGVAAERVLLVGVGHEDERGKHSLHRAGIRAGRRAFDLHAKHVALALHDREVVEIDAAVAFSQFAAGFSWGIYRFDKYLRREDQAYQGPHSLTVLDTSQEITRALRHTEIVADAIATARDMVNEPPGELTPERFAAWARRIAVTDGLECHTLHCTALIEGGFNLIEAVGRGSDNPPALIHLIYRPVSDTRRKVAFVGKGITFDTGGYSLKQPEGMQFMHSDMAGGAAVLGAAKALAKLSREGIGVDGVEIHFLVPTAENSVSGRATRPTDIVRGYGGKTVQILNTDAEGRLVLADALAYAQKQGVDTIVDVATLTGSSVVALGNYTAAVFCDDERLATELLDAADRACEDVWRMPLIPEIDKQLDCTVADMKNIGSRAGGAISAAHFLKRWIDIDRWVHVDMAGPAYVAEADDYRITGGTGWGVATLVEFARRL